MAIYTSLAPAQPRPTSDRFSWDRPDFGGHVTVAANGSHVPDRHTEADSELGGAA